MKEIIKFTKPNNFPVATADELGAGALADWFASDIQYSVKLVDEWINIFEKVSRGQIKPGYQGTGNTSSVMAIDDWIYIENEHLEGQKVLLTTTQAMDALNKYRLFLQSDYKNIVPESFEVEYEAEGEDAFERYIETGGSLGD